MKIDAADSSYEIEFGGGSSGAAIPSGKAFARYAKARLERAEAQKKFLARETRSASDVDDVIEAMVSFDKLRAGRLWVDKDADRLAANYRSALDPKLRTLKILPAGTQVAGLRPVLVPKGGLSDMLKDLQRDERSSVIDPDHTGWYFEKYFSYTGSGRATMQTYQLFSDPTLGGEVTAVLRNPGADESSQATAETGRWFNYVPDKSGYIQGVCLTDIAHQEIRGRLNTGRNQGTASVIQTIDGAVGLLSGDDIIGRLYLQLDKAMYVASDPDAHADVLQKVENVPGGFVMNGSAHVEKGERITVIMGIRVKAVVASGGPVASLRTSTRARPTAFSAGTLAILPPTPSPL